MRPSRTRSAAPTAGAARPSSPSWTGCAAAAPISSWSARRPRSRRRPRGSCCRRPGSPRRSSRPGDSAAADARVRGDDRPRPGPGRAPRPGQGHRDPLSAGTAPGTPAGHGAGTGPSARPAPQPGVRPTGNRGRRRGAGHAHLPRCRQSTTLRVASILRLAAARTQPRSFTHPPIAGRSETGHHGRSVRPAVCGAPGRGEVPARSGQRARVPRSTLLCGESGSSVHSIVD
ncbi:hypothetical protein SAMN02787144_1002124 [Streptomyces atratus]|uniref:Uncharacterized protein n=1 Tax=Streptomyces atratus TaxID=1893 RepID=A0A1K1VTG2_STRAR|nr:hypothetical protein SAMN02787144_1002124 [Streptomyces atratus]